jgi:hypothetical protein
VSAVGAVSTKGQLMPKRYHSSKGGGSWTEHSDKFNDETHHSRSPMKHERAAGAYEGPEDRRKMEMMDAGMIHEDRSQIANLPQEVMIKPYPMTGPYMPEEIDDTIRGVDEQMDYDDGKRRAHFYPKKV